MTPSPTDVESGWALVRAAADLSAAAARAGRPQAYRLGPAGGLEPAGEDSAELYWDTAGGGRWRSLLAADDPRLPVLDLYLPVASAHAGAPLVIAHVGQSLDGCIATAAGDSCFVTGPANILHLHRLRALCDAVIVGAGTAAADDPQLTTRLASGSNPLRVVLDPARRLPQTLRVFSDGAAPTLRACLARGDAEDRAAGMLGVAGSNGQLDLADLVRQLRARGCARLFVEGGGVTVTAFLEAGLVDRLHVAVAPLLIGAGRPALRLPGREPLASCVRPATRIFRMGTDVLYDCALGAAVEASAATAAPDLALFRVS